MTYSPMLAVAWSDPIDPWPFDPENWVMEPKFDGWRAIVHHDLAGNVTLTGGRNGKTYPVPAPIEAAVKALLPKGSAIDGELIHPDGWGGVQGAMTRDNSFERDRLTLVVFDLLGLNQQDTRSLEWQNRRDLLEMIPWPEPTLYLSPVMEPSLENYGKLIDADMEGAMLKHKGVGYVTGRNAGWRKIKATDTCEAECIGFEMGEGEFAELIGAMKVRLPSGAETTASGMSMDERRDMTNDPVSYLGRIVEIKHNGELDSGKVRHPRFMRMRDDRTSLTDNEEPADMPSENVSMPVATPVATVPKPRAKSNKAWMRNYHAMANQKLADSLRQLLAGYGDAYDRVVAHGADLAQHIAAARNECTKRGLPI